MAQNEWLGEERRQNCLDVCKHDRTILALQQSIDALTDTIGDGQDELQTCKVRVDMDISNLHKDMTELRSDLSTIRADMRTLTASVGEIRTSLAAIADSIKAIADFPDTWTKVKGFWSVMQFLQKNWMLLAVMGAIVAYITGITVSGLME